MDEPVMTLEINTTTESGKQRLADENPKQLMETQQWVDMVFERMSSGSGRTLVSENTNEDEAKVKTLAAGVLVKAREVIEAYQKIIRPSNFVAGRG